MILNQSDSAKRRGSCLFFRTKTSERANIVHRLSLLMELYPIVWDPVLYSSKVEIILHSETSYANLLRPRKSSRQLRRLLGSEKEIGAWIWHKLINQQKLLTLYTFHWSVKTCLEISRCKSNENKGLRKGFLRLFNLISKKVDLKKFGSRKVYHLLESLGNFEKLKYLKITIKWVKINQRSVNQKYDPWKKFLTAKWKTMNGKKLKKKFNLSNSRGPEWIDC